MDFLGELQCRLSASLVEISLDYEIILVEDCGGDRSWEIMVEMAEKDSHVKVAKFTRNFGQHHGITAGLDLASGDWVVVMDCDLQDPPESISKLPVGGLFLHHLRKGRSRLPPDERYLAGLSRADKMNRSSRVLWVCRERHSRCLRL